MAVHILLASELFTAVILTYNPPFIMIFQVMFLKLHFLMEMNRSYLFLELVFAYFLISKLFFIFIVAPLTFDLLQMFTFYMFALLITVREPH